MENRKRKNIVEYFSKNSVLNNKNIMHQYLKKITVGKVNPPSKLAIYLIVYIAICIFSTVESDTIGVKPYILICLSTAIIANIEIFARVGTILMNHKSVFKDYKNIFLKARVSFGGIVGVVIAIFLFNFFYPLPLNSLFQFVTPTGFLVGGVMRLGCFLDGCCLGRPTNSSLGKKYYNLLVGGYKSYRKNIALPDGCVGLHPFGLYESVLCFIFFLIFFYFYKNGQFYEKLIFMGIASYSVIRFCTEFLRDSPRIFWQLTLGQIVSVFLFIIFVSFVVL